MVQKNLIANAVKTAKDGFPENAWITRTLAPLKSGSALADAPLAGLCFAAKDNIDVAGLPTIAACPAFVYEPDVHAIVVRNLLDAGAAVFGKTNLNQLDAGATDASLPAPLGIGTLRLADGTSVSGFYLRTARPERGARHLVPGRLARVHRVAGVLRTRRHRSHSFDLVA